MKTKPKRHEGTELRGLSDDELRSVSGGGTKSKKPGKDELPSESISFNYGKIVWSY